MKYLFFLTLASCATFSFNEYISTLNQLPSGPIKATVKIDDVLQRTYQQDIKSLKKFMPKNLSRHEKLHWIHEKVKKKNEEDRQKIQYKTDAIKEKTKIAKIVQTELRLNPKASYSSVKKYDSLGNIGFCFARAALSHYLLLKHGIDQAEILKVFALGQLKVNETLWSFHMATMLKTEKGWLVVDNLFGEKEPYTLLDWQKRVESLSVKKELNQIRYYYTDPRKFQAAYGMYRKQAFEIKELRPYIKDLFMSHKHHH